MQLSSQAERGATVTLCALPTPTHTSCQESEKARRAVTPGVVRIAPPHHTQLYTQHHLTPQNTPRGCCTDSLIHYSANSVILLLCAGEVVEETLDMVPELMEHMVQRRRMLPKEQR